MVRKSFGRTRMRRPPITHSTRCPLGRSVLRASIVKAVANEQRAMELLFHRPRFFDDDAAVKLEALERFRTGQINEGLEMMSAPYVCMYDDVDVPPYQTYPRGFVTALEGIAATLESAGE